MKTTNMADENPSDYQAFIRAKHEQYLNAPIEVLEEAINRATGDNVISRDRIIKGEVNEVHDVNTSAGPVILRVHPLENDSARFKSERWAIEKCAQAGVPVPKVLYVGVIENMDESFEVTVEE